jgi:hypothetical protein
MAPRTRGTAAAETTTRETAVSESVATAPKTIESEETYELALALPPIPEKPFAAFTGLVRLPSARRPELRPACEVINLTRMGNREAILAQSVGAPAPSPCGLCAKSGGPWTSCVVVTGFLRGSCANCHYGGSSVKCTLLQAGK